MILSRGLPRPASSSVETLTIFSAVTLECDFLLLQYMLRATDEDYFINQKLFGAVRPKLLYDGQEMKYFFWHRKDWNKRPPEGFQVFVIENEGGIAKINVRATPEQMIAEPSLWEMETKKDLKLASYVSLIKFTSFDVFCAWLSLCAIQRRSFCRSRYSWQVLQRQSSYPEQARGPRKSLCIFQAISAHGSPHTA